MDFSDLDNDLDKRQVKNRYSVQFIKKLKIKN